MRRRDLLRWLAAASAGGLAGCGAPTAATRDPVVSTPSTPPALTAAPASPSPTSSTATPTPTLSPPVRTPKKGVGAWDFPGLYEAMADSGCSWYYDWSPYPLTAVGPDIDFVPMIWGAEQFNDTHLEQAARVGHQLLAFNEPNLDTQANLTPRQALAMWPKLQDTGLRLGSPATSKPSHTSPWMEDFMDGARRRGYRVDFVATHYYGSKFRTKEALEALRSYLFAVHQKFKRPLWLTEYALIHWAAGDVTPSAKLQAAFAEESVCMLEALPYVERYAWFSLSRWERVPTIHLYDDGPVITRLGRAYSRAG